MKNVPTRTGIYYSVDKEAKPVDGHEHLYELLQSNLEYPEEAKKWGVEGNVYVQFVVKRNGQIGHIQATEDIESSRESFVEDLKNAAIKAVKATSGEWDPAYVNDIPVESLAVLPVEFRIDPHRSLPVIVK